MNVFLTGATGFLGGELLVRLISRTEIDKIYCLIRSKSEEEAYKKIDHIFNLHHDDYIKSKVIPILDDLSNVELYDNLKANKALENVNVIMHSAANTSFSSIYDKQIEDVNIGGTREILKWAFGLKNLQTFVYVGTASICGSAVKNRIIYEDESPNPNSQHFVKYTYSKMVGESMIDEYIPKEKQLIVRPSIVMGDSRKWIPRSFVIMWAFQTINVLRLVPVNPNSQLDIIPVDYATTAIVELLFSKRNHTVYHISSGTQSATSPVMITKVIEDYFKEKPTFQFIEKKFTNTIKRWAKTSVIENGLSNYNEYLNYWKEYFVDTNKIRILFAGLEPYLEFCELGQIFDNSRLLQDTNMGKSIPAHQYIVNSLEYFDKIDVFDGALNP